MGITLYTCSMSVCACILYAYSSVLHYHGLLIMLFLCIFWLLTMSLRSSWVFWGSWLWAGSLSLEKSSTHVVRWPTAPSTLPTHAFFSVCDSCRYDMLFSFQNVWMFTAFGTAMSVCFMHFLQQAFMQLPSFLGGMQSISSCLKYARHNPSTHMSMRHIYTPVYETNMQGIRPVLVIPFTRWTTILV